MAVALVVACVIAACAPTPLVGQALPSSAAPDFALIDGPTGATVTLESLRGKVVVLTFLYTNCPDVCPLTAEKFRTARDALGDAAKGVAFVAVSVDPARDTPDATRRFAEVHGLQGSLRYLIGGRAQLAKVWTDYGVAQYDGASSVGHTDAIYLIDRSGRTRVLIHSDVAPDGLTADLRALAAEK
ncbi:MAG: SCO family protein [Candidatus Limnocylindria bacterium]